MPLRMPQSLASGPKPGAGWSVLDYEIAEQKAHTLGRLGHQVEQALRRLREFDAGGPGPALKDRRSALLDEAAERVWAFMVQREVCGLRSWEAVVREYGIPREVLNRVGRTTRELTPGAPASDRV
jgi:hypothetical protein